MLSDIKYEHLYRLVEYLYTGKTQIDGQEVDQFFLAVKRFNILGLIDFSSIRTQNANSMAQEAPPEQQSDNDDMDDSYEEDLDNKQTEQHETNPLKRKSDEHQNGASESSFSQIGETSQKIPKQMDEPLMSPPLPTDAEATDPSTPHQQQPNVIDAPSMQDVMGEMSTIIVQISEDEIVADTVPLPAAISMPIIDVDDPGNLNVAETNDANINEARNGETALTIAFD